MFIEKESRHVQFSLHVKLNYIVILMVKVTCRQKSEKNRAIFFIDYYYLRTT